jgi:hypothetical protein
MMTRHNFPTQPKPESEFRAPTEQEWGAFLRRCDFSWSDAVLLWRDDRCAEPGRDDLDAFAQGFAGDRPRVHFVGFRGEEYWSAVRLWGKPDYTWSHATFQILGDCAPYDTVVFGPSAFNKPKKWRAAT